MQRTKLHRLMNTAGITDTMLSRESGVSIRQINYIKLGKKSPTLPTMAAILDAFNRLTQRKVSVTEIFDFTKARSRSAA